MATFLSDQFNTLWNPAWNVAFIQRIINYNDDSVMYGYAFSEHWMWINNYKDLGYSFVVWKDYNCGKWMSLDSSSYTSGRFTPDVEQQMDAYFSSKTSPTEVAKFIGDIWVSAKATVDLVQSMSPSKSYSAVISQGSNNDDYYRICMHSSG